MTRRGFLGVAGAAALGGASGGKGDPVPAGNRKALNDSPGRLPNIVFIMADDLGYGDLSCYGQRRFSTPNIDALASAGMRFTDVYSGAAVCAPSRCCLMTGKHTGHARIRANRSTEGKRVSLAPDDVTVAEVLKRAGYRTCTVGKWGIGEAGTFGIPNDQGFDEWYGFLNQDHALDYYPSSLWDNRREIFPEGNQGTWQKEYAQHLFTERAVRFMRDSRDHPFFLYLPYTLPHSSSEIGRQTGDGYVVPNYGPFTGKDWANPDKGYAEMVRLLDQDVGWLRSLLRQLGVESNTIVFFTSDNGFATDPRQGYHPAFFNSGAGFRGGKGTLYEGGIRAPMIVSWPGHIQQGTTSAAPWAFWDFLPTAAEIAGVPFPDDCDGVSVVPQLTGKTSREASGERLYWESYHGAFAQAARAGHWKIIRTGTGNHIELYDLATDPGETHNRAAEHPEIVRRMLSILDRSHTDSADYAIRPEAASQRRQG